MFNGKNLKPSKNSVYSFIFNFILLVITLSLGYYYIPHELQKFNQENVYQQDFIKSKNEFIRRFTILGQSRIYQAERYYKNIKENESKDVINKSWNDYMITVIDWNKENLLNPIFLNYYFNNKVKDEYNNDLILKLVKLHEALLKIRDGENIENEEIEKLIENAKHELYVFCEQLINI